MLSLRHVAFYGVVCLGFCQMSRAGSGPRQSEQTTEYLGGTIRSVQPKSLGSLNFADAQALSFHTGSSTFRLEYSQIRSFHFSGRQPARRSIGRVTLPSLPLRHRDQVLDLSFRDTEGGIGTASFLLGGAGSLEAGRLLAERMETGRNIPESSGRLKLPESWWGDKYWKTSRNKAAWPDAQLDSTVAGTK